MLNRTKILTTLQNKISNIINTYDHEKQLVYKLWEHAQYDEHLCYLIHNQRSCVPFLLPSWQGHLSSTFATSPQTLPYRIIAVDGSQIYPDHHQGIMCTVINIGSVDFYYNNPSTVNFDTEPFVFFKGENQEVGFEEELINAQRTELEWRVGLQKVIQEKKMDCPQLFVSDGSLIFWHLDAYEIGKKQRFLTSYLTLLQQFYEHDQLLAGYISLSQSKELINVLQVVLKNNFPLYTKGDLEQVIDVDVFARVLQPGQRTIIFKNHAPIVDLYPDPLKPYFFYLNTGHEIARIEIPAWIAHNEQKVQTVAAILYDQALKGHGYPIALSEAHEQAVVKEADRQFFYQMIEKLTGSSHRFSISLKSAKKRRIGI